MNMEKYRYVVQSGIILLLCIIQMYSNWGIYIESKASCKESKIIKKRKYFLIVFSVLSIISLIWFISELVTVI